MDVFYHLDRTGNSLQFGQVLQLMPFAPKGRAQDENMLRKRFPEGVARFGLDIIHGRLHPAALEREIKLESVRLAHYPHRPSRFISVFGCKGIEDMDGVRGQFFCFGHQGMRGRIWRIKGCSVFKADMNVFMDHFDILYAANSGTFPNVWNLCISSVSISPLWTVGRSSRHRSMAVVNCPKSS